MTDAGGDMFSGTFSECRASTLSFYGLKFASTVNIVSSEKIISPFCVSDFRKFKRSSISLLNESKMLTLLSFKGESYI